MLPQDRLDPLIEAVEFGQDIVLEGFEFVEGRAIGRGGVRSAVHDRFAAEKLWKGVQQDEPTGRL